MLSSNASGGLGVTKIITVHGTFAGDDADSGEKWWQRGSPFLTRLQSYLDDRIEIDPFHWSGANSELDRRQAGLRLEKKLKSAADDAIVIGHSHGGSVLIQALALRFMRARKTDADNHRFVTIGTPMFRFLSNRNPFARFNLIGRLILFLTIAAGIGLLAPPLVSVLALPQTAGLTPVQEYFKYVAQEELFLAKAAVLIGFVVLLWLHTRLNRRRQKTFRMEAFRAFVRERVAALNHAEDEAINSLRAGLKANAKIVNWSGVFGGLFSLLIFFLIIAYQVPTIGSRIQNDILSDSEVFGADGRSNKWLLTAHPTLSVYPRPDAAPVSTMEQLFFRRLELRQGVATLPLSDVWPSDAIEERAADFENDAWVFALDRAAKADLAIALLGNDPMAARRRLIRLIDETIVAQDAFGYDILDSVVGSEASNGVNATEDALARFESFLFWSSLMGVEPGPVGAAIFDPRAQGIRAGETIAPGLLLLAPGHHWRQEQQDCANDWSGFGQSAIDADKDLCKLFVSPPASILDRISAVLDLGVGLGDVLVANIEFFALENDGGVVAAIVTVLVAFIETVWVAVPAAVLVALASLIVALLAAPMLSAVLLSAVRGKAYGNDGHGERVVEVIPSFDADAAAGVGTLPQPVEQEIFELSKQDAVAAVNRLRSLLAGKDGALQTADDPLSMALRFDGAELYHNAYFVSEEFTRYLAAVLVARFGLTPSEKFNSDANARSYAEALSTT